MTLKFGTDGIRGVANQELTPELSLALGRAAASVLSKPGQQFLVGRDTRQSGPSLQAALTAGLTSGGANVVDVGVLPTPGVAHLSAQRGVPAAMISASHNPFADNGIKFFLPGGKKLSDEVEEQLEAVLQQILSNADSPDRPVGAAVGTASADGGARQAYEQHLCQALGDQRLDGLHVVLDCANGAASEAAPEIFADLGARVDVLHNMPTGTNINDNCGSTHPQSLQEAVVRLGADVGLAFDGDADRVLAVDGAGQLVDGDHILGMLAIDAKERGLLKDDTLVVTVMSNLGLRLAMERHGIAIHETAVGDRYVLEALNDHGWSLGGEQSGHVIFSALATTGDGLLTGLQMLSLMARTKQPLTDIAAATMTRLPQVLRNVRVARREALDEASAVWDAVAEEQRGLGKEGRVLLRPSGTEPLIRVMVEAPTQQRADEVCSRLCRIVEKQLT